MNNYLTTKQLQQQIINLGFEIFALLVFLIALPIILIDAVISKGRTECDD